MPTGRHGTEKFSSQVDHALRTFFFFTSCHYTRSSQIRVHEVLFLFLFFSFTFSLLPSSVQSYFSYPHPQSILPGNYLGIISYALENNELASQSSRSTVVVQIVIHPSTCCAYDNYMDVKKGSVQDTDKSRIVSVATSDTLCRYPSP